MFTKKLCLAFLFLSTVGFVEAQQDSTKAPPPPIFKPTITLGTGMLGYMGDIGNNLEFYSPDVSRPGFELRAGTPVNSYLEASVYAIFGQIAASERTAARNLNFHSRITTGGFMFTYNFDHLLKPDRVFEPYVSVGFETVEFLSKTDLYDANGNMYHYWSDGTIRNLDESAPNADAAVEIQRDYVYESDIRELDLDGFGKYDERTFAVPIGIGGNFKFPGGFGLRVGSAMHFTFTDYIDGITNESLGNRKGSSKNDRFLFTSVSLSYGIDLDKKKRKASHEYLSPEEMDQLVLGEDQDGDGVIDLYDACPFTPAGVEVDTKGCPVDGDGDGVADYMDDEPNTPAGTPVNERGVTITDEEFLLAYEMFVDSTGKFAYYDHSSVSTRDIPGARKRGRTYVVQVGSDVEGISEEMISKILSIPDVRTVTRGDTTIYLVGDHAALPDAVRRQLNLEERGIDGQVMLSEGDQLTSVGTEADSIRASLAGEEMAVEDGPVVLRVQLGAFKFPLAENIFEGVQDLVQIKSDDGLTHYYSGSFDNVNDASQYKADMLGNGFNGAFMVAFRNGERITLKEAGAAIDEMDALPAGMVTSINKDMVRFHVQVGAFAGNVPADVMNIYIEVGEITPVKGEQSTKYYFGEFDNYGEAEAARLELLEKGLQDAFVVGSFNNIKISTEEAKRILDL